MTKCNIFIFNTLLLISFSINLSFSELFQGDQISILRPDSFPICKLFKDINVNSEVQCGQKCVDDNQCSYFHFDNKTCIFCTTNDASTDDYVSHSLQQNDGYKYLKLQGCSGTANCTPVDCSVYRNQGYHISGVYTITTNGQNFKVYCDMETDGGGWTVFQRRIDGSEDFYRTWNEYETGFGNLSREFWLGNSKISSLTNQGSYQLRIDMSDFEWTFVYVAYDNFKLDASDFYRLTYSSFKGNTGNGLQRQFGQRFSAKDRDLDTQIENCAVKYKGAWWYSDCHHSNLNGMYLRGAHTSFADGVNWYNFRTHYYSLRLTEMKLRPVNFTPPYTLDKQETDLPAAKDCAEYRDRGVTTSGIYSVTTRGRTKGTFDVYCDMETSGGGWLLFQRRIDGSVNFHQNWIEFENGFGNLNTEFWLGNDNISSITEQGSYELRIDMEDFENTKRYANYAAFSINRDDKYKLWLGTYSGDAGDSLTYHNGQKWSSYDADNDGSSSENCVHTYKGAWWHDSCHYSNLNGLYLNGSHSTFAIGVNWKTFKGYYYSLKLTEMKIRPAGYQPPV